MGVSVFKRFFAYPEMNRYNPHSLFFVASLTGEHHD
jgi:hypothetical protein